MVLVQSNCKYSVIEYDYKYCKYRSSHLHYLTTKEQCNCHLEKHGKWVAAFYKRAEHVFFMSNNVVLVHVTIGEVGDPWIFQY